MNRSPNSSVVTQLRFVRSVSFFSSSSRASPPSLPLYSEGRVTRLWNPLLRRPHHPPHLPPPKTLLLPLSKEGGEKRAAEAQSEIVAVGSRPRSCWRGVSPSRPAAASPPLPIVWVPQPRRVILSTPKETKTAVTQSLVRGTKASPATPTNAAALSLAVPIWSQSRRGRDEIEGNRGRGKLCGHAQERMSSEIAKGEEGEKKRSEWGDKNVRLLSPSYPPSPNEQKLKKYYFLISPLTFSKCPG